MKSNLQHRRLSTSCLLLGWLCFIIPCGSGAQSINEMTPGITTLISGGITIESEGDWINQGILIPGLSTLALHGPFIQHLRQDMGSLNNLTIDKNGGEVSLAGNVTVSSGIISLLQNDLDLDGFILTLDPAATLSETPGNTVKGNAGYITTIRTLMSPAGLNIGGMGLLVWNTGSFGATEIRRGHAAQSANGEEGILRYFDFWPAIQNGLESTIVFLYDESELNGNIESDLHLYQSPDDGVNWIKVPGVLNTSGNQFQATGVDAHGRFTLSSHCLETCIATIASAHSAEVFLNAAGLAYLLPENVDNGSRGACGIDSLKVEPEVFDCMQLGTQEVQFTVYDHQGCSKSTSVQVLVMDDIPPVVRCKNITLSLDASCQGIITPSDIDDGSFDACGMSLSLNLATFDCTDVGSNQVVLTATDGSGNSAQCEAMVTIELAPPEVVCRDVTIELNADTAVTIDPMMLVSGDPEDYGGFVFQVDPATLYCDQLGDNEVILTSTNPAGQVTVCTAIVRLTGPDADCDHVADQCDQCNGGDDRQDTDGDGIPDCADWDGWNNLIPEWQCAANKVFVCHSGNVICVNQNAVQAHLSHGDFLGSCTAVVCDNGNAYSLNASPVNADAANGLIDLEDPDIMVDLPAVPADQIRATNIPNPFYPECLIRFYLPEANQVTLSVYDCYGKKVAGLFHGALDAGWHEVHFDGHFYTDGIYRYQIRTDQQSFTKSMILMRN